MSEPRVSDAELAEWIKQAEEYAAGDWQMDDAPYFGAAVFDLRDARATLAQRDASIAALVEALARCMSGDPRNSAKWQHALDVLADHAAFAAERDERLRAPLLTAGNALAEAAEHLLYCDLGRCDDCNKARTVIAAWREAAK